MKTITGGCLCGRVHYQADGPALFGGICHCRSCQRASGSGGLPVMGVAEAGFAVSGEPKAYTLTGGSGQPATRWFCGDCGGTLYGTGEAFPGMVMIYCGSLDDAALFTPQVLINTADRAPWHEVLTGLPAFTAMPDHG